MTSKKLYQDIAREFAKIDPTTLYAEETKNMLGGALCQVFKADNPLFDEGRFTKACAAEERRTT